MSTLLVLLVNAVHRTFQSTQSRQETYLAEAVDNYDLERRMREIDRSGRVSRLVWLRPPRHAPEVIAEIERTVREASPFPAPSRLGKVVYTDTWLWHKSGQFQLDTLTEGQD